jgi:hypothetical protein
VVFEKDGSTQKELMTVAATMCWIARTRGATEAAMLDHDLEPLTEEHCSGTVSHYTNVSKNLF